MFFCFDISLSAELLEKSQGWIFVNFYCVMLCIGALYAVVRCPSVRLGVCHVHVSLLCWNESTIFSNFFHYLADPPFYFFTKPYGDIPTESTLTGVSNAGIWTIAIFDQYLAVSRKQYDSAILTMERCLFLGGCWNANCSIAVTICANW